MSAVENKLDELASLVATAKAVPLSASCVVNRAEMLALVEEVRDLLPNELAQADGVLRDRGDVVAEGQAEADRIIERAKAERTRLVSRSEVALEAQRQAERTLADARQQAATMRAEVEDYVDGKLANFEVVLHKTIAAVERGRDKLRGRVEQHLAEVGETSPELYDRDDSDDLHDASSPFVGPGSTEGAGTRARSAAPA